jgi:hypothetical protein
MVTEKQPADNRANARKSTGPRTFEGRRRGSQNALKHGVLAKAILIEGECEEGFLKLCKAYVREYSPQTPTEPALVNKAVTAQCRALRAASLEAAAVTYELQRQSESIAQEDDATRAMLAVRALHETSAHMERLSLYAHRFDPQHRHAIRDLQRLRVEKMNLNKPTHFDEATKQLIAPTPISKPIDDPSKAA